MVDVSSKIPSARGAIVSCKIHMNPDTLHLLKSGQIKKGDAFTVAKTAAILGAKKTPELIPLCHPLPLELIDVRFQDLADGAGILVEAEVRATAKTGVEMEAFMAASLAAITLYDMAKGVDPGMRITDLKLMKKTGGKSDFLHESRYSDGQ